MTRPSRRGFTLVEMTIAAALLGVLFAALGVFVSRWEAARRSANERALALRAVENALEHAIIARADTTSRDIDPETLEQLRSPKLLIQQGDPDDLGLIPVTATLTWQNAQGQTTAPVSLTAWRRDRASRPEAGP